MISIPASGNASTSQPYEVALTRASSDISSMSIGSLLRYIATMIPRPITTSQAAITITISANTWPASLAVHARERHQREVARVQHQLEAEQHHERVAAADHAGGADREDEGREDEVPGDVHLDAHLERLGGRLASSPGGASRPCPRCVLEPAPAARQHDGAHGGHQQQERGGLERQQEVREQQLADLRRASRRPGRGRRRACRAPGGRSR